MDITTFTLMFFPAILILAVIVLWLLRPKYAEQSKEYFRENKERERKLDPDYKRNWHYFLNAQELLTEHFQNNLKQNRNIYLLTVVIIIMGFGMIFVGILQSVSIANENTTSLSLSNLSLPATLAGVITEFIAATILLVYKSVFEQTTIYFQALERFSTVGMSIRILDDLTDDTTTEDMKSNIDILKIEAKTEIAKLLIQNMNAIAQKENKKRATDDDN